MDADKAFQGELTTQCESKATEFDKRSKARAAELTAMAEALEILKAGVESMYGANKKLVGLSQQTVSLVQLDGSSSAVQRVLQRLNGEAKRLGSVVLASLASKVVLQEDHFVKVRGLINDLITRLEEQKAAEAKAKSFCDKQMEQATGARDKQALAIEEHTATISIKEAEKKQLLHDIKSLSEDIAGLHKALNEATELRSEEKATNEKTIADAVAGKAAVADAITVLTKFYGDDGALLQAGAEYVPPNSDREGLTVADRAPKMSYSGDYKGQAEGSKGIIGLLQVIESDFARTETTVGDAEKDAQSKFEEFEKSTKESIKAKEGEKTEKESAVKSAEEAITTAKDDLNDANSLHQGALEELNKLSAMCVDGEESYAERKRKREEEIAALKDALRILEDYRSL